MDDDDFMRRAIELALEAERTSGDTPFGTVIVQNGQIVGEGRNRVATNCDPTAHSEVEAIRAACKRLGTRDLTGCVMFTSGEPCPMCAGAIWWAKLDRIHYGASRADCIALGLATEDLAIDVAKPIEERRIPASRLLNAEAIGALQSWLRR